jgi:hypothetical protein
MKKGNRKLIEERRANWRVRMEPNEAKKEKRQRRKE